MRLIAGLGNPEKKYQYTRHNFGYLVVEEFANRLNARFKKDHTVAGLVAKTSVGQDEVCLLLPLTYMNHSGLAVKQMAAQKKIELADILVVCDDLDLDFGSLRLRAKGSAGGHNGLKSIIDQMKTQEFARLRLGIGQPYRREKTTDFVLTNFSTQERKELLDVIQIGVDCCQGWLTQGISKTMSQFNKKEQKEE